MIDFNKAITSVSKYKEIVTRVRDFLSKGTEINENDKMELESSYEILVRPYAEVVNLSEPGQMNWHGYIIEYNNPAEWGSKKGDFFSLNMSIKFLHRLIGRLSYYQDNIEEFKLSRLSSGVDSAIARVQQAIRMFDTSVKILSDRRSGKKSFEIDDEYDVQDLLQCILKPQFPDLIIESHTLPIAKGEKRIDIVIPSARIVIEIKFILESKKVLNIVDQLKVDIESYHSHSHCGTLICFIYNPKNQISDPEKIINDLSGTRTKGDHVFEVVMEIYPK